MGGLLFVGSLVLGSACASVPAEVQSSLVRCYQFQYDAGARALGLPWGFVLHAQELGDDGPLTLPNLRRAETATSPAGRLDYPFGFWRVTSDDSVQIGHPGGGGFSLSLFPEGQDLAGSGRAVGDVLRPGETPPARGRHTRWWQGGSFVGPPERAALLPPIGAFVAHAPPVDDLP